MPTFTINLDAALPIIATLFIVAIILIATENTGRSMLQRWAANNDLRLIKFSPRYWRRGPFFWTTSKNQLVYRITAQTRDGQTYEGWARCGSWMWGIWVNQVEARWDGEEPPTIGFRY